MKFRLYYGFDCDSVNGFNNGYYLDDIKAKSLGHAYMVARKKLEELSGLNPELFEEIENGFEVVTGYYDDAGNEILEDQFHALNENEESGSWRYVYVTIEEVS
jgi:hypothetical protein